MSTKQDHSPAEVTEKPWHALPTDKVLEALETSEEGLSAEEARERLDEHGPNRIPRTKGDSIWVLAGRQIHNPLIYVLLVAGVLALLMGKTIDGAVVLGVVLLNTLIGFVQEYRAGRAIESLMHMVSEDAVVYRDGKRKTIPAEELVPGDVVVLQAGDKAPADLRLLKAKNLQSDESALTGESVPVSKSIDAVDDEKAGVGDRHSMVHSSSLLTSGSGLGVVAVTGGRTQIGRISEMIEQADLLKTPLTRNLEVLGKWLTAGILAITALLLIVGLLRGFNLPDATLAAISMAVAAIPEGLPAIVTIALSIGVQRMARRRAIVRQLPAVETLGSTTIICSDKTGTLTRNEMTVQRIWIDGNRWQIKGVGYQPEGELQDHDGNQVDQTPESVLTLLHAAALCNESTLHTDEEKGWVIQGDPTEGALVVAAAKLGIEAASLRKEHKRVDVVPFDSDRKFMATLHRDGDDGWVAWIKGAPDVLIARSRHADEEAIHEAISSMAAEGLRVLAVAAMRGTDDRQSIEAEDIEDIELLGLVGLIDPPREEAITAIKACHSAGIVVKMITGDHPKTALAIAENLGLAGGKEDHAVTGAELEAMDEAELTKAALEHNVFARVAPEHKLKLVRAMQSRGEIVAMTGDGVNDAPALRQADIGVAMGITGTAVSKEAGDIVLTDDNFATIEAAVEEGRRVFDNLIKALAFVLPTNLGQAMIVLLAILLFPIRGDEPLMPIRPAQILWVNLVVAVLLSLPLAFEGMERRVMKRKPRRPDKPILDAFILGRAGLYGMLMTASGLGMFFWTWTSLQGSETSHELALAISQTMTVTTIMVFQTFYMLECRRFTDPFWKAPISDNYWVVWGVLGLLAMQALFTYLPIMQTLFGTAALGVQHLLWALLAGAVVLPVIAVEKAIRRRQLEQTKS